jgi:hypothetical protein
MAEQIQFLDNWKAIDVGGWIAEHLSFLPASPISRGDHVRDTGANAMLDAQLRAEASDY